MHSVDQNMATYNRPSIRRKNFIKKNISSPSRVLWIHIIDAISSKFPSWKANIGITKLKFQSMKAIGRLMKSHHQAIMRAFQWFPTKNDFIQKSGLEKFVRWLWRISYKAIKSLLFLSLKGIHESQKQEKE